LHFSLGLERQISAKSTLTVTYSNSRGVHQFFSRDINAPLPPLYGARPDSAFGAIRQYEAAGRRVNNSLRVQYRGELTHYFTGMAQYRLGSAHDNTDGIGYYPSNQYDLSGEWARSNWDRRNNFELLGTFRPGKLLNLGMGLSLRSGSPYTMTTGLDNYHDGMANERPLGVPRNSLQSTGFAAMNLRWSKDFRLVKSKGEKGPTLTPAVDAFNVTNRVNFGGYVGNLTSPLFGLPTYADSARRLQLSIRFQF
jgi:hypothetical protein